MAVPKKRTSKSKKNLRKTVWKKKAVKSAIQSYFLANSIFRKENLKEKTAVNLKKGFGQNESTETKSNENLKNQNNEETTK